MSFLDDVKSGFGQATQPGGVLYPGIDPASPVGTAIGLQPSNNELNPNSPYASGLRPGTPAEKAADSTGAVNEKLDAYIKVCLSAVGYPYTWDAVHPEYSQSQFQSYGENCSGFLSWACAQVGINPPGDLNGWISVLGKNDKGPPSDSSPAGTFVWDTPEEQPPEGHIAFIYSPGKVIEDTDYGMMVRNDLGISRPSPYGFNHSATFDALGTSGTVESAATDAVNTIEGLSGAIGQGIVRAFKYAFAYTFLRPFDFASGFAYELPKALLGFNKDQKNKLSDQFWVFMFFALSYYLAFGKGADGGNFLESLLKSASSGANIEPTKEARTPVPVGLRASRVGVAQVDRPAKRRVRIHSLASGTESASPHAGSEKARTRETSGKQEQKVTERGSVRAASHESKAKREADVDREVGSRETYDAPRAARTREVRAAAHASEGGRRRPPGRRPRSS